MGIDFLEKTRRTFVKHIDYGRAQLAERTLFTALPRDRARSFVASIGADVVVEAGQALIAQYHKGEVYLLRGNVVIGKFDKVPLDVVQAIDASGGVANGIVDRALKFSNKADVSLC